MGRIGFPAAVIEIPLAHLLRPHRQPLGDPAHDLLHHQHPLRPAESPERRVGGDICPRHPPLEAHVRDVVSVVQMEQRPIIHRHGKIQRPPSIGNKVHFRCRDHSRGAVTDLVLREKRMPFPGHLHVHIPIKLHPHRPAGDLGGKHT